MARCELPSADTQASTSARDCERPEPDLNALFKGKYLSLTSFRRDGTGVATPVWFVLEGGQLLVLTGAASFKAKRILRDPTVTIARCSAAGRLRGKPVRARAEILPASELSRVEQLMGRKYRIDRLVVLPIYRAVRRLRGFHDDGGSVVIAVTPT
ncbi:MAG: PPOX class F420-dependent oxidoreductase [Solirubrobacteraceae bacterium]